MSTRPTDRSRLCGGHRFSLEDSPSPPVVGVPALLTTLPSAGGLAVIDGDLVVSGSQTFRIRANDTIVELISGRPSSGSPVCDGDGGPATSASFFGGACRVHKPRRGSRACAAETARQRPRAHPPLAPRDAFRVGESIQFTWGVGRAPAVLGGDMYVSVGPCNVVRKILANGTVVRFAGGGAIGAGDRFEDGTVSFDGPATTARLASPTELAVLADGTVVFADRVTVYAVTPAGRMTALTSQRVAYTGLTADVASGTVYVCNIESHVVSMLVRIDSGGDANAAPRYAPIVRIAGNGRLGHSGDGGPASLASLAGPASLALFRYQLYIAELHGDCVRVVNLTSGIISTFAGAVSEVGGPPSRGEHVSTRSLTFALGPGFLDVIMVPSFVERLDYATWGVASVAGTGAPASFGELLRGRKGLCLRLALQRALPTRPRTPRRACISSLCGIVVCAPTSPHLAPPRPALRAGRRRPSGQRVDRSREPVWGLVHARV